MALPKFYKVCQDQQGNIVPQVLGSVFNHGTAVLASLYQDDAGTLPLSNPMTSDAQYGSFKFYVNPGHYDLTFTKPGYTFEPIMDFQVPADTVILGTMATQNANAVAITGGSATGLTQVVAQQAVANFVGIANATPTYPLDMTGNARITGVLSVGSGGFYAATLLSLAFPAGYSAMTTRAVASGTGYPLIFQNSGGGTVGSIASTDAATAYNTSSDVRLKHRIERLVGALGVVQALTPVTFQWKADDRPGHGFLAHEVQAVVPGVITGEADAVDEAGQIVPQQIDHAKLVPWLTAALQELAHQVQTLTARLAALEASA